MLYCHLYRHGSPMSITLTESAAARVKDRLKAHKESAGVAPERKKLRLFGVGVSPRLREKIDDADCVFESHGVKVIVENAHLEFLKGTEIDYIQEGLSSAFHFKNPNVTEQCGCGESFTVN